MADTAIFSIFHRPRPQSNEPVRDLKGEADSTPVLIEPAPPVPEVELPSSPPELDAEPVVDGPDSIAGDGRLDAPALPDGEDDAPPSQATTEDEPSPPEPHGPEPHFLEPPHSEPSHPVPGDAIPDSPGERPAEEWPDLAAIALDSDQLGLAHPDVITLIASLPDSAPIPLAADVAGLYRPAGFRPAPWSGFAYDMTSAGLTGLAAGTRILTARGEIEVERLLPGDMALALRGASLVPISWIGRSVASGPPVLIEPGALGPNLPRRTLCLGPDQPVFVKPVPVAAHSLVNGTTIRETEAEMPDLFHIDVGRAEVLLAEGLPLSSSHRASLRLE